MGQYIVWVIMSIYLNQIKNVGYIGIGTVFLVGGLLSVPISIYGGNLLDRIGRRAIQILIPWALFSIYVALFFLVYLNMSTFLIILLFIVAAPIQSVQYVAFNTIVSDVTSPQDRVNAFGILRITANAGIGVGLVSGGFISEYSYALVFLLPALGSAVEGVLYFLLVPETSKNVIEEIPHDRNNRDIFMPFKDGLFVMVSFALAISWFFNGMFESAMTPLYLTSVRNYQNLLVTGLFAVNTIVVIVAQGPINRILYKMRDSIRIEAGVLLFAVGYLMFALTYDYWLLIAAVIVLTVGENIGTPSSAALITKIAPEEQRGTYLGFYSSIGNLFSPFRPLFGTALLAYTVGRAYLSWFIIAAVTFLIVLCLAALFKKANRSVEGIAL